MATPEFAPTAANPFINPNACHNAGQHSDGQLIVEFIDLKTQQARIREDLDQRMAAVLDHGRYVLGPEVQELEQQLAEFTGARHCVSVGSGTDAAMIALMCLNVGPDDEVITTPFTFIATGEVIALLGAKPVFVDIDPRTFNIDAALVEAAIGARTKAIMPVSLYGQCADMTALNAVAEKHGLPVVEDGAQSFGALQNGKRSCALSTIGCTSFFPAKPLGCYGEGGAIFTDDDALAQSAREIRVHGQDRRYHHARLGLNGRLETLQAAVLLAKMRIFPDEVEKRAALGARFSDMLHDEHITTPYIAPHNVSVFGQYTVRVEQREQVIERMSAAGIPTAVHYPIPLYRQPALLQEGLALPEADKAAQQVMSLPFHPYLTEQQMQQISAALRAAVKQ
jgi:UDP-2-acetamido-2-deoxy-ribo-hexuluronate aminotransferase